jgi:hypothetical protein
MLLYTYIFSIVVIMSGILFCVLARGHKYVLNFLSVRTRQKVGTRVGRAYFTEWTFELPGLFTSLEAELFELV